MEGLTSPLKGVTTARGRGTFYLSEHSVPGLVTWDARMRTASAAEDQTWGDEEEGSSSQTRNIL